MKYYEKFKKRDMDESDEDDPAIKYFKKCFEKNSLLLPIFEKIYRKTLCLQNYVLSEGQCEGIAEACQFIDHKRMNRVLLNNCGITGNKMATIVEGLTLIKDFKSIIYKHNELNALAVAKMEPLLLKYVPNNLSELQIIDCKIHTSTIEKLMELMIATRCQVRIFSLVNVHHSEASFARLCDYVKRSSMLQELNLSWQCLRPATFHQLLSIVKLNRTLVSLTLSHNKFIEDQPLLLTPSELAKGIRDVKLSR